MAPAAAGGAGAAAERRCRRSPASARTACRRAPTVTADLPEPGEDAGHRALDRFVAARVDDYASARNDPGADATSRLSPYLRFGCLHPRQLLRRLDGRNPSHDTFAKELAWRDFYADVLDAWPASAWRSWNPKMAGMEVDRGAVADERFAAWCAGRTGFPIVDAGMRQLVAEGWMHNRVRMITASFLVKDLHVDWTAGARFFMDHLVDGDLPSNNHGWQWVAGTGTDAAPYFRIFNPTRQSEKFDPDGTYIRRWVPELADLDAAPSTTRRPPPTARRPATPPDRRPRHRARRVPPPLRRHPLTLATAHGRDLSEAGAARLRRTRPIERLAPARGPSPTDPGVIRPAPRRSPRDAAGCGHRVGAVRPG